MIARNDPELYICNKFLDLVEIKPFYLIKVKELVSYAEIGRSTFYFYFDSIYAVVQKIEDDFLTGFLTRETAISIMVDADISVAHAQIGYFKDHFRVLNLLTGPNGDPSFRLKLERHLRMLSTAIWEKQDIAYTQKQRDYLSAYLTGGTISGLLWLSNHADDYNDKDMQVLFTIQVTDIAKMLLKKSVIEDDK